MTGAMLAVLAQGAVARVLGDDPVFTPPPAYDPASGNAGANQILGLLAWCASAAGVAGVILVGINLALQFNRGTPGEGSEHFRGLVVVLFACIIAASAGPIVTWFGDLSI